MTTTVLLPTTNLSVTGILDEYSLPIGSLSSLFGFRVWTVSGGVWSVGSTVGASGPVIMGNFRGGQRQPFFTVSTVSSYTYVPGDTRPPGWDEGHTVYGFSNLSNEIPNFGSASNILWNPSGGGTQLYVRQSLFNPTKGEYMIRVSDINGATPSSTSVFQGYVFAGTSGFASDGFYALDVNTRDEFTFGNTRAHIFTASDNRFYSAHRFSMSVNSNQN